MKFTVDTDMGIISVQKSKFSAPIPDDQKDFWAGLSQSATQCATDDFNPNSEIAHCWIEGGKLVFGSAEVVGDEVRKGKQAFYFDLSSYSPKTNQGLPLAPNRIPQSARHVNVLEGPDEGWLSPFCTAWHCIAYPENTIRKKVHYMFSLDTSDKIRLASYEKCIKAGFLIPYRRFSRLRLYFPKSLEDLKQMHPWDLFHSSRWIFRYLCDHLENFQWDDGINKLFAFRHWNDLAPILDNSDFVDKFIADLSSSSSSRVALENLIENHTYDKSRLLQYLYKDLPEKQGFANTSEAVGLLDDYAGMCTAMHGSVEDKYPKYLKTAHDIAVLHTSRLSLDFQEMKIMSCYDGSLNYTSKVFFADRGVFGIYEPESSKDVVEEGIKMHHCVARYVSRICESRGTTKIVFMQQRSRWGSSILSRLCTIELYDSEIVQVKKKFNADPNGFDLRLLNEWAKEKNLVFSPHLEKMYKRTVGHNISDACDAGYEKKEEVVLC